MVHLNQNHLSKKQIDDLFTQIAETVAPKNANHSQQILNELMGAEERIMFAKRLAVVVLLVEGRSKYKIGKLLKLSQSTVDKIEKKLQADHFETTLKTISSSHKKYYSFLKTLDSILHLGGTLPHYNGLDRYRQI